MPFVIAYTVDIKFSWRLTVHNIKELRFQIGFLSMRP